MTKKNLFIASLLFIQLLTADVLIVPYAYDQGALKFLLVHHNIIKKAPALPIKGWKGFWGKTEQDALDQAKGLGFSFTLNSPLITNPTKIYFQQISPFVMGKTIFTDNKLSQHSQPINNVAWIALSELLTGTITVKRNQQSQQYPIAHQLNTAVQQNRIALQQHFNAPSSISSPSGGPYAAMIQKTLSYGSWPTADASAYDAFKIETQLPEDPELKSYDFKLDGYNKYTPMGTEKWERSAMLEQSHKPWKTPWDIAKKTTDMTYILFYSHTKPFYEFANFWAAPLYVDDGSTDKTAWPTSEHYFQAHKFTIDSHDYIETKQKTSPKAAFDYARARYAIPTNQDKNANWFKEDLDAMLKALWAKFTQNDTLKDILLGTKPSPGTSVNTVPTNSIIIEDALGRDSKWGNGTYGDGLNHLGQMLMFIRARLLHQIPPNEKYVWRKPSVLKQWVNMLPQPGTHSAAWQAAVHQAAGGATPQQTDPQDIFKLAEALHSLTK